MSGTQTADEILDRFFLEMRARVLELAADFDRIERADHGHHLGDELRLQKLRQAIDILNSGGFDRAERIQLIFSDPYQADWNQSS